MNNASTGITTPRHPRQNVWILTAAQAFSGCGTIMLVAFGGIVGTRIAPSAALATLPLSLSILGVASASLPAALLMQRIGRRRAFVGSALIAACAALLCAWAVAHGNFALMCVAGFGLGCNMAFVQQYRFAATEFVDVSQSGQAVATVILGTLVAAIAGPTIGTAARNLGDWPEFTGSYVVLAGLCLIAAAILTRLDDAPVRSASRDDAGRSLRQIASQPAFRLAVLAGIAAYAVMSFIMTATPISMHVHDGFSSGETTSVITAHLLGMYLPSLATPALQRWLGMRGMMLCGLAAMAACILISAVIGHAFVHYFTGLVLLGLGWNLLFVAGTQLLTTTYAPSERFRAQGCNDLAVFGSQAVASLLAGTAMETIGWETLNVVSLPLLAAVVLLLWRTPLPSITRS
jgi:predicted MFS family arabinose efflux permease